MPTTKTPRPASSAKAAKAASAPRMSLAEAMRTLEKAGSAQTKKTYLRHGAKEPLFGVSFAFLATLVKKIDVDHDLALALWDTGNFDARNLAMKVADPSRISAKDLDRWVADTEARMCSGYVAMIAQEGPDAMRTATRWLAARDERLRCAGWGVVGQMAGRDEGTPDSWFLERVREIEKGISAAPNGERYAMNGALIAIGGRSADLRKAALSAAKRIGPVEVDHGDTACETPDAAAYVEKMWAYAKAKKAESPTALERQRKPPRTRC